jgi:hypothetical protein
MKELIELEERGWQALSSEGDASKRFYNSVLRHDAIMLFPGGLIVEGKQKILNSLGEQPWKSFQIESPQLISLSKDAGVVVYRVTAQREGSEPYFALVSSTYALTDGKWKLVIHQQTPV